MKKLIEVQLSAFKKHYLIIYYTLRRVSVIYPAEISGAKKGIEHNCSLDEAYQILVNNMRKNYNIKPENIKEIQNTYLEQLVINDLMQNKNNKNQNLEPFYILHQIFNFYFIFLHSAF
jgi:hypothetical protein